MLWACEGVLLWGRAPVGDWRSRRVVNPPPAASRPHISASRNQVWGGRPRPRPTPWSGFSSLRTDRPGGRLRARGPAPQNRRGAQRTEWIVVQTTRSVRPVPVADLGHVIAVFRDVEFVVDQLIAQELLLMCGHRLQFGYAVDHVHRQVEA